MIILHALVSMRLEAINGRWLQVIARHCVSMSIVGTTISETLSFGNTIINPKPIKTISKYSGKIHDHCTYTLVKIEM